MNLLRVFTWPKFILRLLLVAILSPGIILWTIFVISRDCGEDIAVNDELKTFSHIIRRMRQAIIYVGYFLIGGIKSLPLAEDDTDDKYDASHM